MSTATTPDAPRPQQRPPSQQGQQGQQQPPSSAVQQSTAPNGTESAKHGLRDLLTLPADGVRTMLKSWTTSPGRLALIATGLVVLCLLTAGVAALMVQERSNTVTELTDRREPLAAAAQQVYRALSDADATASSAFLATGEEPAELRSRYDNDIAQAGVFLARTASDTAAGSEVARHVDVIAKQLPVYTELIGLARANNRQGYPAGASYLREASALMQQTILPAAEELYRADTKLLADRQADARGIPWVTGILVIALLVALIATQRYLRRRTNRLFNVGLVVATVAVAVGVLWSSGALVMQSLLISDSETDGTEQVDRLVQARIAGLKARADETLTLVARGDGEEYEKEFKEMSGGMAGQDGAGGLLNEAREASDDQKLDDQLAKAQESAKAWMTAHAKVRKLETGGDYPQAVELAINPESQDSSARAFYTLDSDLRDAIQQVRQGFADDAANASWALTLLPWGWVVLGIIAALGVTVGIQERLREYR